MALVELLTELGGTHRPCVALGRFQTQSFSDPARSRAPSLMRFWLLAVCQLTAGQTGQAAGYCILHVHLPSYSALSQAHSLESKTQGTVRSTRLRFCGQVRFICLRAALTLPCFRSSVQRGVLAQQSSQACLNAHEFRKQSYNASSARIPKMLRTFSLC